MKEVPEFLQSQELKTSSSRAARNMSIDEGSLTHVYRPCIRQSAGCQASHSMMRTKGPYWKVSGIDLPQALRFVSLAAQPNGFEN